MSELKDKLVTLGQLKEVYDKTSGLISGEYYSEEEKCIGRWIDGKPLYQRVIRFTNVTYAGTAYEYQLDETVLIKEIVGNSPAKNAEEDVWTIPTLDITNNNSYISVWSGGNKIYLRANGGMLNREYYVIIKYTKTTDTPSTPIPQSVLPTSLIKGENYSTEEQCIGRWIDGKPLYSRVYSGLTYPTTNYTILAEIDTSIQAVNTYGYMEFFANGNLNRIAVNSYRNSTYNLWVLVGGGRIAGIKGSDSILSDVRDMVVVIEYTKTTDTAQTPVQTSLLSSDEVKEMIDTAMGDFLGGRG